MAEGVGPAAVRDDAGKPGVAARSGVGRVGKAWLAPGLGGRLRAAALVSIMILAVALRVWRPGLAEFKMDEVQPIALADTILHQHRLPLARGHTSIGLPGTPLLGYLLVLPRAITADPRAAVVTVALLGCLAVLATYLSVRRFASEHLALVAAGLFAANPWAVFLSRKTWSEVLPVLTVLMLWSAYEVVAHRKPAWALAFFPLLALQIQTHVLAVLYLPATALMVALYWRRWRTHYALYGVALFGLILLPYAVALWMERGTIRAALAQGAGQGVQLDLQALSFALWFTSGATVTALLGQSVLALAAWERALRVVNVLTALLLLSALGYSLWRVVRRRPADERLVLLLVWLVGPVLPLVFMREAKGIHYLLLLVPAFFVLAAMAWACLLRSRRRALAVGSAVALVLVLVVQAGAVVAVYDGISRLPSEGGFGRPLEAWLPMSQGVHQYLAAGRWPEVEILGLDDAPWSTERNVLDCLLQGPARLRYVGFGGRPGVLVPAQGEGLALVLTSDGEMERALAELGTAEGAWPIAGTPTGARLYRIRGQEPATLTRGLVQAGPGTFENGMRLVAARLPEQALPGDTLVVATYWTYTGRGAHPAQTAFSHLVDATGERWAQDDGFALSRSEWRPGETLLQWCRLALPADLPPGEYWLYTGMYCLEDMSRAQLLGDDGQWLADGVKLGPILVVAAAT